jgi:TolA-binding protein
VIAAIVGAYLATRGGSAPVADPPQGVVEPPPPPPLDATPSISLTPLPGNVTPSPAIAAVPPPSKPTPQIGAAPVTPTPSGPAIGTAKPPAGAVGALPTPVSKDSEAAQRLDVAKAKLANNLHEQALADLRQIILEYPNTAPAAEAAFLAADVYEKTGQDDQAMGAFVEFEQRFAKDRRAAESKLRRATILSRRPALPAQMQARDLWSQVARDYAGTPHAQIALQSKLRMETDRKNLREMDPVMKIQVPAFIVTLRTIIEQFPETPQAQGARVQLARELIEEMDRYADGAVVLEQIVARDPSQGEVWWRLAEIYERRLKNPGKARDAYGKIPSNSPRYAEAQRRLKRR